MPEYKNYFKSPVFNELTICQEDGSPIGTIRIKPSSILWKPKGKGKFLAVNLNKFSEWIMDPNTRARLVKK